MIMPRGVPLLLPANPWFIGASILLGLAISMLPFGRVAWMPDVMLLLIGFWCVHQPQRVGIGLAFLLGLCMDVQESALLGQHALSYSVLACAALYGHRRLLWFSLPLQALQVFPLFLLAHAITWVIRLLMGGVFPGWTLFLAPVIEAVLWPIASALLLAPQRQAPDQDENRPL